MGLYRSSSHVYWRCKYHIVWTPKYRFRILKDKLGKELYRTIYILCGIKDCEVLELNVQPDHVHLVVIIPPKISISTLMGHLKGRSAIRLYNRFPHIRKKLWGNHFWSRGYFVDTVGLNKRVGESGVTGENQLTEATFLEGGLLLITVHNTPQQPGKPHYHAEQNKQQQHPGDRDFQQGT